MQILKTYIKKYLISEKLRLHKNIEVNAVDMDIKGDTYWTNTEIDKIINVANDLDIIPKIIDNYDNEAKKYKKGLLYLRFNDKTHSMLIMIKNIDEKYFSIVFNSDVEYFMPYSAKHTTGFETLDELLDNIPETMKKINFYDNIVY